MANKIKYGLSNVYYSKITYGANDAITYGTPVALPGAVNMVLTAEGETSPFFADNIIYFTSSANNGYTGTLELALIPTEFRTDILGEIADTNGVLVEKSDVSTTEFALLFQFEGDDNATKHVMYRCVASRPEVSSSTKEASITPTTETLNLTVMPTIADHLVKAQCLSTSTTQYAAWETAVYVPTI